MLHKAGLVCGVRQTSGTGGVLTKVKIGTGIGLIPLILEVKEGGIPKCVIQNGRCDMAFEIFSRIMANVRPNCIILCGLDGDCVSFSFCSQQSQMVSISFNTYV